MGGCARFGGIAVYILEPGGRTARVTQEPSSTSASRPSARLLTRLASFLERHPAVPLLFLSGIYLLSALGASRSKPLWHDELFTFWIAQAPTWRALVGELRVIDLNPPLVYLATRMSFRLFGVSTLTTRLPEIAAFLIAMLAAYRIVERRAGVLYGSLAAAVLLGGLASELAVEARPYALVLAFLGLSFVAWQSLWDPAGPRHRGWTLVLLAVAGTGLLLSHLFGLLVWAALGTGELVRLWKRRRDWVPAFVWLLPLGAVATYLPALRNHARSFFPPAFVPGGDDVFEFYIAHVDRELVALWLTALAILLLLGRAALRPGRSFALNRPEWTATISLMLIPAILIAWMMHTNAAFFPRYGIAASFAIALFAAVFLAWWTDRDPRAALLGILIALLIQGQIPAAVDELLHPARLSQVEPVVAPCAACALTAALDPAIPLVDASGLAFLEMNRRESPATLDRVFYLTDPEASLQYAHANIFEGMGDEARVFPLHGHVQGYAAFRRQHTHFFVLGMFDYPEDWLLRKLQADGANLRVLRRVSDSYRDHELYEVTF